jgi:hypothetical protein
MWSVHESLDKAMVDYKGSGRAMSLKDTAFFWLLYAVVIALVEIKEAVRHD